MKIIRQHIEHPEKEYKDVHFVKVTFDTLQDIDFEGCTFEKCNFSLFTQRRIFQKQYVSSRYNPRM